MGDGFLRSIDQYQHRKILARLTHIHAAYTYTGISLGISNVCNRATKVQEGSSEPASQMGLDFDTEIGKKVSKDIYHVTSTKSKAWFLNTKNVSKKSGWKISPKFFEKFISDGVRVYAFTAAKLTMTYTHECLSNILNAACVKVS